jgi:tetratricopeptide (TPR) repeat protein
MTAARCAIASLCLAVALSGAVQSSPGYAAYEKANALLVAKKLPEALAAVDEALRLDPKLVPALTLKAKLAMAAYRLDVARRCLEEALALDPRAAYAQFLYGRAALYLGLTVESLGQPSEALSLYEEAVRLERSTGELHAETLLPGARLLLLLGRLDECDRWIRQALKLSPDLRDAHFEFARLLLKKGDAAQAAAEGETALRLSEGVVTDSAIRYQLVRAYQQCGMPDKAATHAAIMRAQESQAGDKAKN